MTLSKNQPFRICPDVENVSILTKSARKKVSLVSDETPEQSWGHTAQAVRELKADTWTRDAEAPDVQFSPYLPLKHLPVVSINSASTWPFHAR